MTLRGIDVSSHQPTIDWGAVAAAGYDFAIVKACGGTSYRNLEYQRQLAGARAAGLVVGSYHYAFEATVPGPGPEAEADYFLATTDMQPGDLVALDFEEPSAHGNLEDWALRWLRRVETALGFRPLFYTYPDYVRTRGLNTAALAAYPLWWASYDNPPLPAPSAWGQWAIWQNSGGTDIPGIPNDTDENVYPGTRAQLLTLGKPGATPPPAGPTPPYARSFINERGEALTEINYGGVADHVDGYVIQDAGITVINAAGEKYARSVTPAGFGDWRKV